MASGYGLNGGQSRCFAFWQELLACYVVNTNSDDVSGAKKCLPALEDYEECLHHRKEYARTQILQDAYRRAEAGNQRENAPTVSQVRNLGLLGQDNDSRAVMSSTKTS